LTASGIKEIVKAALRHRLIGHPLSRVTKEIGLHQLSRFLSRFSNYYPKEVYFDVVGCDRKTRRGWMNCADANDHTARLIWLFGFSNFEKPLPNLYAKLICGAQYIINVGANSGFYVIIGALVCPTARIDAFEPYPPAIRWLGANLQLNHLTGSVNVFKVALGDTAGQAKLYIPSADHGVLETAASLNPQFVKHHSDVLSVPLTTIDNHIEKVGVEKVGVIQLDVESQEHVVLEGASKTLDSSRPLIIFELLHIGNCEALEAVRRKFGYRSFQLTEDTITQQPAVSYNPDNWNQLLCPEDKLDILKNAANDLKLHFLGE